MQIHRADCTTATTETEIAFLSTCSKLPENERKCVAQLVVAEM